MYIIIIFNVPVALCRVNDACPTFSYLAFSGFTPYCILLVLTSKSEFYRALIEYLNIEHKVLTLTHNLLNNLRV